MDDILSRKQVKTDDDNDDKFPPGISEELGNQIIKNMIPFELDRNHIFCSKTPVTSNLFFMRDFENWDVIVGKVISPSIYSYTTTEDRIDTYSSTITTEKYLKTPGSYHDTIYTEIVFTSKHPSGTFFFKGFLDEIYMQMPSFVKEIMKTNKIYVSTHLKSGNTSIDHTGSTRILIPVNI